MTLPRLRTFLTVMSPTQAALRASICSVGLAHQLRAGGDIVDRRAIPTRGRGGPRPAPLVAICARVAAGVGAWQAALDARDVTFASVVLGDDALEATPASRGLGVGGRQTGSTWRCDRT